MDTDEERTDGASSAGGNVSEGTRPESAVEPSFTAKQAIKTSAFWTYATMAAIRLSVTSGVNIHGIPAMEHMGFSREVAATIITAMTLMSIPGRLGCGWLGDRYDKRYIVGTCLVMLAVGIIALSYATDITLIIVFLLFFSPANGGLVILDQAVVSDYFGRKSFASIAGLFQGITMWGVIAGPVIAGYFFDLNNSYQVAFQVYCVLSLLAVVLVLFLKRPVPVPDSESTTKHTKGQIT